MLGQTSKVQQKKKCNACWTTDGRIFVKMNVNGQTRIIIEISDLDYGNPTI